MDPIDSTMQRRIGRLHWVLPLTLSILIALYQSMALRWLLVDSPTLATTIDSLFDFIIGPASVFLVLGYVGHYLNERGQAEQRFKFREHRLASIVTTAADAIISTDADGKIETWNQGAESLLGFVESEMAGSRLADLMGGGRSAEVEARWLLGTVQREHVANKHEMTCRTAFGGMVNVELTAALLDGETGEPPGIVFILRNITKRKRYDEEIKRLSARLNQQSAERARELGEKVSQLAQANLDLKQLDQTRSEFVSLVSHQIRAPLTNMTGAVQRMQADCRDTNPTCKRMFDIFAQQVSRLDRLVQDVLDTTHIEAGEMTLHLEPVSVLPVVQQVVREMETRSTARPIHVADKPGLPLVYADHDRVGEVLSNLLDNADKYSPPGEAILIEARADQSEVTISVQDSGSGLPAKDLERVFDKFYRVDSSDSQVAYGYGLGLYVCRLLVEAHNGRIWVENRPDGGAVFSFSLPVWGG